MHSHSDISNIHTFFTYKLMCRIVVYLPISYFLKRYTITFYIFCSLLWCEKDSILNRKFLKEEILFNILFYFYIIVTNTTLNVSCSMWKGTFLGSIPLLHHVLLSKAAAVPILPCSTPAASFPVVTPPCSDTICVINVPFTPNTWKVALCTLSLFCWANKFYLIVCSGNACLW